MSSSKSSCSRCSVAGTLSILIVNWNSKEYLRKCLQSVRATCAELQPQVVVVDGGSYDGCDEMLAAQFPEAEFVQSPENVGFARSNNLGFQYVRGEALLLLNPDCELRPGAVQTLLHALQTLPASGIVGPRLVNTDGTLQTSCVQALPTPLNQALDSDLLRSIFPRWRLWGTWDAFHAQTPVEVEAISGACMVLRSNVFRGLRGFSADYFMYGEDMDLCAKARHLGLKVYHVPTAEVVHHGGGSSSAQGKVHLAVLMRESARCYIRRHYGWALALGFRLTMLAGSVLRLGALMLMAPGFLRRHRVAEWRGRCAKWCAISRWALGLSTKGVSAR